MVILRFIHLLTFVFWYGTLLYFSFVQAPLLFANLPREVFGEVQNRLFPVYYLISYICGSTLVVTYHLLHPLKTYQSQDCIKITGLCLMLLFSLAQGLWIGPKVARIGMERRVAEQANDQSQIDSLRRQFGKAHGISSLFNLLVIVSGTVYLFYYFREMNP